MITHYGIKASGRNASGCFYAVSSANGADNECVYLKLYFSNNVPYYLL